MSSFFTVPGAHKKRKRPEGSEARASKKRIATSTSKPSKSPSSRPSAGKTPARPGSKRPERDESISGSDSEDDDTDASVPDRDNASSASESENENETAAERRLRLAERYLANVRQETAADVDAAYGFDAEDVDRELISQRLIEDAAATKGKVYRHLADSLSFPQADAIHVKWNTDAVTSVAVCDPYAYTATKNGQLVKWQLRDLPRYQFPQTTRKKPKKPPAPPRRQPERLATVRSNHKMNNDRSYLGPTGPILCVAASEDGKFVVTGGADRRLVIYSAADLKPIRAFTQHRDAVTGLAFRRGTNQLYSCSRDRTVKVWSLDELAYVETLFGHQDDVADIDALAQERCVSVGARDRTARLWKVVEETQLVFRGGGGDSSQSSGKKKKKDNQQPETLPTTDAVDHLDPGSRAHEGCMDRVAMLDDELFVTGSDNGAIALWSIQKKKPLFVQPRAHGVDPPLALSEVSAEEHPDPEVIPAPQPRWITALKVIPYSDLILSGSWDGCVRVWKLSRDKRKIEAVGVLGAGSEKQGGGVNGDHAVASGQLVKGMVNDIAMFERGNRGRDGLCVVVAVGKEHRLGRWKTLKEGRNGAVVFEVPKVVKADTNGNVDSDQGEEEEEDGNE